MATLQEEVSNLGARWALVLPGKVVAESTRAVTQVAQSLGDLCAGIYSGLSQKAPLASAVDRFNLELGMPHRLRTLEDPREDFPHIAQFTLGDGGCLTIPVPITKVEQVMEVSDAAF
ncbi:MAG: hypothetical protein BZY81_03895 [SAR202 cluster bacterium Io17-Chloro-G4]|nr:MAG: hypothetical protein BZY81_03895 [SAR202 cluster bacterium Io17-Chloro-G4]